jgi:peroxiredoxin
MTLPTVGDLAPDFTLPSTAGEAVTLSSFRGGQHVLIAFFPLAFTSVCTAELCAFSEDYSEFTQRGAVVLPVSVDSTPTLKAFRAQERITVDLLSDFKRTVSRSYGVLDEEKFQSRRAYFLVDTSGTLRWLWVEKGGGFRRENGELLSQLEALD